MAKKFEQLRQSMSTERRQDNAVEAAKLALSLNDLRSALAIAQQDLANRLDISQAAVSKALTREDMLVSSLQDLIHAMGGELEVRARFGDQSFALQLGTTAKVG